jgi:phosphate transport system substrate-binding protein
MKKSKTTTAHWFYLIILLLVIISACKNEASVESSPTIGKINIVCDIQLKDIIQQEEDIFEKQYKYADVDISYHNEYNVLKLLMEDSARIGILCRALNKQEIEFFKSRSVNPRMYPFAKGALALLCNKESKDTSIRYEDFIELCTGRKKESGFFHTVIIEDVKSGISQYVLDKAQIQKYPENVYTLEDKQTILSYLKENKQAIAVVDWSEFADSDNTIQQAKLEGIKVLAVSRPKDSIQMGYLYPDQYHLQDDIYPLTRTYHVISISGKSDLGLGFVSGDIGQKILLKAGLLPLFQTERWIELNNRDFRIIE